MQDGCCRIQLQLIFWGFIILKIYIYIVLLTREALEYSWVYNQRVEHVAEPL